MIVSFASVSALLRLVCIHLVFLCFLFKRVESLVWFCSCAFFRLICRVLVLRAIRTRVPLPSHAFTPRRCLAASPNVTRFISFCSLLDEQIELSMDGSRLDPGSIELCVEPIPHSLFHATENRFIANPEATSACGSLLVQSKDHQTDAGRVHGTSDDVL